MPILVNYISMINRVTNQLSAESATAVIFYRGRFSPLLVPGGSRPVSFSTSEEATSYAEMVKNEIEEKSQLNMSYLVRNFPTGYNIDYSLITPND